jgi:uncharacterized protein YbjT (DUF2867 family)
MLHPFIFKNRSPILHSSKRFNKVSEMTTTNRILVTGASGNIGSALVANLQNVMSGSDSPNNGIQLAIMRSKSIEGNGLHETRIASFSDVTALTKAFSGIDTVFLLFPLVENKLELARNAAAAARAAGVKHIVRSSGAGADANSSFALPKLQGTIDAVLAETGIATTFLRPAGFMQNYANYQSNAIKQGAIYMADGGQAQSLIDVRDIAAVAAKVLVNPSSHAGKIYTLTGGADITGPQAAQLISRAIGKTVTHHSVSTEAAVQTMQQWGMPAFTIDLMDSLNKIVSAGYASGVSPDVQSLLERAPLSFEAFVQEHAPAWKA